MAKTLSSVSSAQTTATEDGVQVSRYAYTPSSLRIMRETNGSANPQDGNRWGCYDCCRMALGCGGDGDTPVQTKRKG